MRRCTFSHVLIPSRSTDSATCRRAPRRPSTVAEHAMRKMVPGPDGQPSSSQQVPANSGNPFTHILFVHPYCLVTCSLLIRAPGVPPAEPVYVGWKGTRPHVGPSQTSSVDEGVADMDSQWDDTTGSMASNNMGMGMGHSHGSSVSSGIAAPAVRSRADWKWPARGSSGSSVLISSDMSQVWKYYRILLYQLMERVLAVFSLICPPPSSLSLSVCLYLIFRLVRTNRVSMMYICKGESDSGGG